jgi:superfamily II DNA helicase RecQ
LQALLEDVRRHSGQTPKQLHEKLFPTGRPSRDWLAAYLDCLGRASLVELQSDKFEKDGRVISFQRIFVTREGRDAGNLADVELWLSEPDDVLNCLAIRAAKKRRKSGVEPVVKASEEVAKACYKRLQQWRKGVAQERRCPPFRIASNATLRAISRAAPVSDAELLDVKGMGPSRTKEFGKEILAIVQASQ